VCTVIGAAIGEILGNAGPVGFHLVAGDRATDALGSLRIWLGANGPLIMTVLLLVPGAKVLSEGLAVLS
jgi:hypothetical protein